MCNGIRFPYVPLIRTDCFDHGACVSCSVFLVLSNTQSPLQYKSHSPVSAHFQKVLPSAVLSSHHTLFTAVRGNLGFSVLHRGSSESRGAEPLTFMLVDDPLYPVHLLSHSRTTLKGPHQRHHHPVQQAFKPPRVSVCTLALPSAFLWLSLTTGLLLAGLSESSLKPFATHQAFCSYCSPPSP